MIHIATKNINSSNLLTINAVIELKEIVRERIFFEFYLGYNREKAIKMALNSLDLRALSYGIKEVLKRGESRYKKITESGNEKKFITLNKNYINASTSSGFKIGIQFQNEYEFISFADFLTDLARYTEQKLFEFQQNIKNKG